MEYQQIHNNPSYFQNYKITLINNENIVEEAFKVPCTFDVPGVNQNNYMFGDIVKKNENGSDHSINLIRQLFEDIVG